MNIESFYTYTKFSNRVICWRCFVNYSYWVYFNIDDVLEYYNI